MPVPITLAGITKSFAPGSAAAVDNVSLDIAAGELFFLLGPSGCGKTTLLRMIAGFIEPTAGLIRFGPREVTNVPPNRRNTGMVFQSYALWPHMTVEANVAFGLSIRRIRGSERRRRVGEALDLVRMREYASRKPNQLSGGQQQRVALARALVIRPDVLLLDEPLSNLDAKLRVELRSEIRRICKEVGEGGHGTTTVYVTHDQKEALSMADRVAVMRSGKVVQIGTPVELYRRPISRFVAEFIGETNFIEGTMSGAAPPLADGTQAVRVQTEAGELLASAPVSGFEPSEKVLCSIRPEAIAVVKEAREISRATRTNFVRASAAETTYLGELAVTSAVTSSGNRIRYAKMNPFSPRIDGNSTGAKDEVILAIEPQDVVILPRD